jgi:hypothetical protein
MCRMELRQQKCCFAMLYMLRTWVSLWSPLTILSRQAVLSSSKTERAESRETAMLLAMFPPVLTVCLKSITRWQLLNHLSVLIFSRFIVGSDTSLLILFALSFATRLYLAFILLTTTHRLPATHANMLRRPENPFRSSARDHKPRHLVTRFTLMSGGRQLLRVLEVASTMLLLQTTTPATLG